MTENFKELSFYLLNEYLGNEDPKEKLEGIKKVVKIFKNK
jgi:hypothetical protein